MAGISQHRWPALVRLRSVLRLARRLPDVADVLPLGPVRMAEPRAQAELAVPVGPRAAAWRAADPGGVHSDADRPLSGLSGDCRRAERERILAAMDGLTVLAVRPAVVHLAAPGIECHRGG